MRTWGDGKDARAGGRQNGRAAGRQSGTVQWKPWEEKDCVKKKEEEEKLAYWMARRISSLGVAAVRPLDASVPGLLEYQSVYGLRR